MAARGGAALNHNQQNGKNINNENCSAKLKVELRAPGLPKKRERNLHNPVRAENRMGTDKGWNQQDDSENKTRMKLI